MATYLNFKHPLLNPHPVKKSTKAETIFYYCKSQAKTVHTWLKISYFRPTKFKTHYVAP